MAQLHFINGSWVDPVKHKLEDGKPTAKPVATINDVLSEFQDNTRKLQGEYKNIKQDIQEEDRLDFTTCRVKLELAEIIVRYRNGEL